MSRACAFPDYVTANARVRRIVNRECTIDRNGWRIKSNATERGFALRVHAQRPVMWAAPSFRVDDSG